MFSGDPGETTFRILLRKAPTRHQGSPSKGSGLGESVAGSSVKITFFLKSPKSSQGFQVALPTNAGGLGSISGLGKSPGGEHGNPLQYSCLENLMDSGARWATVYGMAESWTQFSSKQQILSKDEYPHLEDYLGAVNHLRNQAKIKGPLLRLFCGNF